MLCVANGASRKAAHGHERCCRWPSSAVFCRRTRHHPHWASPPPSVLCAVYCRARAATMPGHRGAELTARRWCPRLGALRGALRGYQPSISLDRFRSDEAPCAPHTGADPRTVHAVSHFALGRHVAAGRAPATVCLPRVLCTWLHKGALMCWPAQRSSAAAKVDAGADITLAVANWGPGSGVARLAVATEILSGGSSAMCNDTRRAPSLEPSITTPPTITSSHPTPPSLCRLHPTPPPSLVCGRRPEDR